jgi:hypothetical protein
MAVDGGGRRQRAGDEALAAHLLIGASMTCS